MPGRGSIARRRARRAFLQPPSPEAQQAARLAAMTPRERRRYLRRHHPFKHVCAPDGCTDPGAHHQGEDDPTV